MKRLFLMLAFIGSTILTSSYASGNPASPAPVTQAFHSAFEGARDIRWEQVDALYKVTFYYEGQYRSLFYNNEGGLIAETRYLSSSQLPKALHASLQNEMQGRWVTNLFVVSVDGRKRYYATLENADQTILVQSAGAKKWVVYQKNDK